MLRRPTSEGERSAEERARAAAERAARRAEREGRPYVPPPPETFGAWDARSREEPEWVDEAPEAEPEPTVVEPEPVAVEPEPTVEEPEPVPVEPEATVVRPAVAPEPAPEPEPTAVQPAAEPEPQPVEFVAEVVHEPVHEHAGDPLEALDDKDHDPEPEAVHAPPPAELGSPPPPGSRPAVPSRGERWRPPRRDERLVSTRPRSATKPRAAATATATPGGGDPDEGGSLISRILAVIALGLIALAFLALNAIFQPFHGQGGKGAERVRIPAGADVDRIGEILAGKGIVSSSRFFSLNATLTGRRGGLKPGSYSLPRDLSYRAAIDALNKGPKAKVVKTFKLTIPEGRSIEETDAKIDKTSIDGDYAKAARGAARLKEARKLGLPAGAKTLEGFLYPATYDLPEGTSASELVSRQLTGFADNTAGVSYARAKRKNLTRYEVLIIASMIEREAQLAKERPLVAAVIYNRLSNGMTLGIDATIRYATNNWTRPILQSELDKDGPYNTRTRRGLPPTPIGNPGLSSIKAAARPANSDFLYYVVKPGGKGEHAFSSSDAEFQRDVARYQQARGANGGQAP